MSNHWSEYDAELDAEAPAEETVTELDPIAAVGNTWAAHVAARKAGLVPGFRGNNETEEAFAERTAAELAAAEEA